MIIPSFQDILQARITIAPYLKPTPIYHYPNLSEAIGTEVWVKHENHLPIRAFKVRGGINFMANFQNQASNTGVITASTGNHGQSVAYAARLFNIRAVVAMPNGANEAKVKATQNLGAEVRFIGNDFDDCRQHIEKVAEKEGLHYLSSGDDPLIIAGVGTYTLEILEDLPDVDVIIVPVGGGSGAAGACIAAKATNPLVEIIGVQAAAAPAAYLSWKEQKPVEAQMETFAEGLATRTTFDVPQAILQDHLDDFVLVSEQELMDAVVLGIEKTHNLVEASGAASLAAACKLGERLQGKRIAIIMSGGNITLEQLRQIL
jgi:threonine dehydratase